MAMGKRMRCWLKGSIRAVACPVTSSTPTSARAPAVMGFPFPGPAVLLLAEAGQDCLATGVSAEQAESLARQFPQAGQDRVARTFWLPAGTSGPRLGRVLVVTAGTSDLPVAREAVVTAQSLGAEAELLADV